MRQFGEMVGMVAVAALIITAIPPRAQAVPLTLQLTIDELTQGRAVFSGNVEETFADPLTVLAGFNVKGANWAVRVELSPPTSLSLKVQARHISDPAPHPGEVTPGLLLGGGGEVFQDNLRGLDPTVYGASGPQDSSQRLIHPGSEDHFDILLSHLDDLNGDAAGFLTKDGQLSVRIDLSHTTVPELSSCWLLGLGLLGIASARRWSRA